MASIRVKMYVSEISKGYGQGTAMVRFTDDSIPGAPAEERWYVNVTMSAKDAQAFRFGDAWNILLERET